MKNYFKSLFKSFRCAFNGIKLCFIFERNFRIHLIFALSIFLLSLLYYNFTKVQIAILTLTCTFVLVCEIINTCIEKLMDYINTDYDKFIKNIKDISAGAVVISSLGSIVVGYFLFWDIDIIYKVFISIFLNFKNFIIFILYILMSLVFIFGIKEKD